jgi:membrane protease YdiL (CAAX protease family)
VSLAWTLRHKDDAYAAVSSALFVTAAAMWSLVIGPFNWVISADPDTIEGAFQDKLAQFLAIVPVVLVVAWLVGRSRESLYLVRGNSSRWLKVGVPSLASWAVLMTLIAVADGAGVDAVVELAPWAIGFAVLNAAMEELWFRGISLQPYLEHLGAPVAIGLTAFVFGLAHVEATYMSDATQLPFAFLVLGLGVVLAWIMHWSNSIWGAVLFHTGMGFIVIFDYL